MAFAESSVFRAGLGAWLEILIIIQHVFPTELSVFSRYSNLMIYPIANKVNKYTVVTEAHKECTCAAYAPANLLQKANSGSNWRLSSEQVGGTECSCVCHVLGTGGISPGYFLPQQGIVSMFLSGVGRQPISASPVLFLANEVWFTWLKCCRLCEHECSQAS